MIKKILKTPPFVMIKTIASALVWGLGQFLNRQFIKGFIFLAIFAGLIGIEVSTGSYDQTFNIYDDKMPGDEISVELANYWPTWYYYNLEALNPTSEYAYTDFTFLHDVAESNDLTFDEDDLQFYTQDGQVKQVDNISYDRDRLYAFLGEQLRDIEAIAFEDGVEAIEAEADELATEAVHSIVDAAITEKAERDVRLSSTFEEDRQAKMESIATEALIADGLDPSDPSFDTALEDYINDNYDSLLVAAFNSMVAEQYDVVYEEEFEAINRKTRAIYYLGYYNNSFNDLYGSELLTYDSIGSFRDMLQARLISQGLQMDNDDYNKMLAHIYFEYDEALYETTTERVNNFYYERAGFFVKGIWGLVTMGSIPQTTLFQHQTIGFLLPSSGTETIEATTIELAGHHSTQLLLRGIISFLVLAYVIIIYVWNVRDAYKTALYEHSHKKVPSEKAYFKDVYADFFEYIVLTPALIIVTFVSILPIIFGILVAFTNYNIENIPPGQLIQWVGLSNFKEVFSLTSGSSINFGGQFWKVFSWTLIWAFFATFTCFFGGFVQAVILNNKRVVFRKVWRGVLILPWAVPALISQMIFRVVFNDNGYVNQVLLRIGVNDILKDWGLLGRSFQEAGTGLERLLYFGDETIQWLSNEANPWFVRIFLIILNVWLGFPFFMALMSGVMTSIDKSLYEAASIDGATGFQQFRFITMPLVLFATSPLLIMTFSGNFNNFGVIYFITGGGPGGGTYETAYAGSTDILISWIYTLTTDANVRWYSMASVFSILIFLIIGTLSAWNFTRTRAFQEVD
jgi:arabinogalactan oligomer/maltooligosaccharide transport system permease protein